MDENKNIFIKGINNKYMMKKVIKNKKEDNKKKHNKFMGYGFLMDHKHQNNFIGSILNNYDKTEKEINEIIMLNNNLQEETQYFDYCKYIFKEINGKINNYRQQDLRKNIFNGINFITYIQVLKKLFDCSLKCHYCYCEMYILYDIVREPTQWTLDRINNNLGHSNENTLVSCLKCNLKRRNVDMKKFEKSKEINKIVKLM